tara:strand:+ start:584 stop:1447 length:864 start_codon:yes stop_codon:yes gene_type:complete
MVEFDIFQTVGPKDFSIIKYTVNTNKKNILGYKNINLFSEVREFNFREVNNIDSDFFPFNLEYVQRKLKNKKRAGWVYAQLVKMYYPFLQNKSDYVLVVDSDVFFTKEIEFFDHNNKPYFTTSDEYHKPYFSHMLRVHPDFIRAHEKSGISHHMLFNKEILESMFKKVEAHHGKSFYDVYLDQIDHDEESPSADYEIYFHYVLNNFEDFYSIRELRWKNINKLSKKEFTNCEMVSLPHYAGTRPSNLLTNLIQRKLIRFFKSINNFFYLNFKLYLNFKVKNNRKKKK